MYMAVKKSRFYYVTSIVFSFYLSFRCIIAPGLGMDEYIPNNPQQEIILFLVFLVILGVPLFIYNWYEIKTVFELSQFLYNHIDSKEIVNFLKFINDYIKS